LSCFCGSELPPIGHRLVVVVGLVRDASAGPSVKLPGGPHTVEFWAAYETQLNGDVSTGRSFNDLILAYRVSPEFDKRAASTKRDYLRYLESPQAGDG